MQLFPCVLSRTSVPSLVRLLSLAFVSRFSSRLRVTAFDFMVLEGFLLKFIRPWWSEGGQKNVANLQTVPYIYTLL